MGLRLAANIQPLQDAPGHSVWCRERGWKPRFHIPASLVISSGNMGQSLTLVGPRFPQFQIKVRENIKTLLTLKIIADIIVSPKAIDVFSHLSSQQHPAAEAVITQFTEELTELEKDSLIYLFNIM